MVSASSFSNLQGNLHQFSDLNMILKSPIDLDKTVKTIEREKHLTSFGESSKKIYEAVLAGRQVSRDTVTAALDDLKARMQKITEKLDTALPKLTAEYEKTFASVKITAEMALESALKIKSLAGENSSLEFWQDIITANVASGYEEGLISVHFIGYGRQFLQQDQEYCAAHSYNQERDFLNAILQKLDKAEFAAPAEGSKESAPMDGTIAS